jgi:hypothetical protein
LVPGAREDDREASIARIAIRNKSANRGAGRQSPPPDDRVNAPTRRSQEELWAASIAEQPELIGDIVKFIAAARQELIESPPVAPSDETNPEPREPGRRK